MGSRGSHIMSLLCSTNHMGNLIPKGYGENIVRKKRHCLGN